jgi:farnesyl-diphosphate farnesyltransferase
MEKAVGLKKLKLRPGFSRSGSLPPAALCNTEHVDHGTPKALLSSLLREVSRSFYRTLRVLPPAIRPQISLAYLFARTSDTIADTELVPLEGRLGALDTLRGRIQGLNEKPVELGELARHQGASAERVLLENCERTLRLLKNLSSGDLQMLRDVLAVITSGQELDLHRFANASADQVIALGTDAELEDYTYRVAGCVGEFWTKMCRVHLFPRALLNETELMVKAVMFGKGLQLVNILRDLPADLRKGRCYLPLEALAQAALAPLDLMLPSNEPRLRPVYNRYLKRADDYLETGWAYTELLPRRCVRVRLACAWPLLIGRETLVLLRTNNVLEPHQRIKISRQQVKKIIWRTVLYYPWPTAWRQLFFSPHTSAP